MSPGSLLGLAAALFLFIMLALTTSWAWAAKVYVLAIPLTIVFLGACWGLVAYMNHYGVS